LVGFSEILKKLSCHLYHLKNIFKNGGINLKSNTALLIIDVQMAMFAENDPVYQAQVLLDYLKELITKARAAGMPVIYVQHNTGEGGDLPKGSPEWQINPVIAPLPGEPVVHKQHPDSFQDTVLQDELQRRDITRLIVAGMQTEFCIDTTCRRAYSLGYDVTLIKDAHSTWNNQVLQAPQIIAHHNLVLGGDFASLKSHDAVEI
jgi:nicotinamidase-related amidase